MHIGNVFPLRLLGFGLYWAWLFLATVTPSPIFGTPTTFGLPAEAIELASRLLFVVILFAFHARVATVRGRTVLLAICCLVGPAATTLMYFLPAGAFELLAVLAMGLADACIFVLWLCFFGHMKVGETALYMALSYCIGGILCLGVQVIEPETAALITILLPAASGLTFYCSSKYYATETGTAELFSEQEDGSAEAPYPYLRRLAGASGCTAFVFGAISSSLYFGTISSSFSGVLVESVCCMALAIICGAIMFVTKQTQDLCALYKAAPAALILGLVLMTTRSEAATTIGVTITTLGYLMFEITALNDFCIAAKSRGLSLVKTFCSARIAISAGLLLSWAANGIAIHLLPMYSTQLVFGIAALATVAYPTIIFTEKQIFSARNVATSQEKIERQQEQITARGDRFQQDLERFAQAHGLSARETEIAGQLIRGRTVNYISEQFYIAPGTVKTHMHNVYTKVGVHNKMELLDAFEDFRIQ